MRIHWKEQFKEDCKRIEQKIKDPASFRKALYKAISLLQAGEDLSKKFPGNRLAALGSGWFDCYVYSDIVMIYEIRGQTVRLFAVGAASELYKRK